MYIGKSIQFANGTIGLVLDNGTKGSVLQKRCKGKYITSFVTTGDSYTYLVDGYLTPFLKNSVHYSILVGDTKGFIKEALLRYLYGDLFDET